MSTATQINTIQDHLTNVGHISAREAMLDYGIVSLRDAIYRLRRKGFRIISEERINPATNKKYIRYWTTKQYRNARRVS